MEAEKPKCLVCGADASVIFTAQFGNLMLTEVWVCGKDCTSKYINEGMVTDSEIGLSHLRTGFDDHMMANCELCNTINANRNRQKKAEEAEKLKPKPKEEEKQETKVGSFLCKCGHTNWQHSNKAHPYPCNICNCEGFTSA